LGYNFKNFWGGIPPKHTHTLKSTTYVVDIKLVKNTGKFKQLNIYLIKCKCNEI